MNLLDGTRQEAVHGMLLASAKAGRDAAENAVLIHPLPWNDGKTAAICDLFCDRIMTRLFENRPQDFGFKKLIDATMRTSFEIRIGELSRSIDGGSATLQ